jgi:hypothetical protein
MKGDGSLPSGRADFAVPVPGPGCTSEQKVGDQRRECRNQNESDQVRLPPHAVLQVRCPLQQLCRRTVRPVRRGGFTPITARRARGGMTRSARPTCLGTAIGAPVAIAPGAHQGQRVAAGGEPGQQRGTQHTAGAAERHAGAAQSLPISDLPLDPFSSVLLLWCLVSDALHTDPATTPNQRVVVRLR